MKVSHTNTRKQGSASHNDRTFDVRKAEHIDPDRMEGNRYWCVYGDMTFEDAEKRFYEENYRHMLDVRNESPKNKPLTMDDFMRMPRYCPEELILQIGHVGDQPVDPKVFDACFDQYMAQLEQWNRAHGGHMHVLDYAVHKDEATVHAHIRRVFDYTDKDGTQKIGLDRALKEAGVKLPDPGKTPGRRNNRKMEFDLMMKERWIGICEEHGIKVDRTPKQERHQKISDYKRDRRIEEMERAKANTKAVSSIVERTLGQIPDEKRENGNGLAYVLVDEAEYGAFRDSSERTLARKTTEAAQNKEIAAAAERINRIRQESRNIENAYQTVTRDTRQLRQRAAEAGLLAEADLEGTKSFREPNEKEMAVSGTQGKAYNTTRYSSAREAMEDLAQSYGTGHIKGAEPDRSARS